MIYLDLFIGFLKVGCFAFGGAYAAIPLIRDVVLDYGWVSDEFLSYMIAVSESTPGPIMVNLATYVGASQGGIPGALLATLAVILPSFIIIIAVTKIMEKFMKNKYVKAVLRGVKPCMIGIIMATGAWMVIKNLFDVQFSVFSFRALIITALLALVYFGSRNKKIMKKPISPILLIVISAVAGIVGYAF